MEWIQTKEWWFRDRSLGRIWQARAALWVRQARARRGLLEVKDLWRRGLWEASCQRTRQGPIEAELRKPAELTLAQEIPLKQITFPTLKKPWEAWMRVRMWMTMTPTASNLTSQTPPLLTPPTSTPSMPRSVQVNLIRVQRRVLKSDVRSLLGVNQWETNFNNLSIAT